MKPFDITITREASNPALLRSQIADAGVLCLRMGKRLDIREFATVAELFGPIKTPIAPSKDGTMFQYSAKLQHIDAGYVLTEQDRERFAHVSFGGLDEQRPGLFETFHCDDTFTRDPAQFTVLHARALPASGGGPTIFMDMRSAYEALPASQQKALRPLQVQYAHNNENAFPPRIAASDDADCLMEIAHPLVRTHPTTKRLALFMDLDRAKHIVGQSLSEGRALLQSLQDHAEANAPRCEHHWQAGDVLIWDNASVQHKASGNFAVGEERRFWRHMVAGPRPV